MVTMVTLIRLTLVLSDIVPREHKHAQTAQCYVIKEGLWNYKYN